MSIHVSDLIHLLSPQRPKHTNELAAELNLDHAARPALEGLLGQLVGYGVASSPEARHFLLTRPEVKGTLTMAQRGFAFVTPELSAEPNLYVDRHDLNGALHRDRVALSLYTGPDGRLRGRVERVLERGTRSFVGVYREPVNAAGGEGSSEALCYIYPQSDRLPTQVPVERALEPIEGGRAPVDGDLVAALLVPPEEGASASLTARAQAQQLRQDPRGPMIDAAGAVARVLHVIEPASAQGALEAVIYDQGLTLHLPSAVEEAAEAFPSTVTPDELARRKDLRHLPFVTIDPESAKDFDDSIYVQPLRAPEGSEGGEGAEGGAQGGGWRLWVAIADVAHYVQEGDVIDAEAAQRSATLYLPAQAFPMLPHRLSNDLCSLKPRVDRYAMVAEMVISPSGETSRARFHEAVIHSQARFTYDQAASLVGILPPQELPKHLTRMRPQVEALRDCARALQAFRRRRGFLTLDLIEPRINFNERGFVEGFKVAPRHEAHEMVEEAMLAANEAVAAHCIAEGIPALYRIHAPPPEYGLERFEAQSALLGAPLGLLAPRGKGEGERSPKQPPKAVKVHQLSRYLKHNERHPHAELLSSLLLRAMSKALYEPEPGLHFGLGTRTYLHFTSPIRRYPDLWVHRQLKAWLRAQGAEKQSGQQGRAALPSEEDAREVAAHSSRRERLIMDAERRVLDAYKALYMKDHLGEEYEGFVCQTSPKGCMVELNDLPVWCSLDEEALPGFEYDEERFTWHNARTRRRVALGTPLKVLIAEVSVLEGRVGARIVEG